MKAILALAVRSRVSRAQVEIIEWWRAALRAVPGETGCAMRRRWYGFRAGPGSRVLSGVVIYYPAKLSMGSNVGIASLTQLNAGGGISIGNDVLIGPGCLIWSQNHRYESAEIPVREQGYSMERVCIEDDVWIAAGATVLPGVRIRQGTVVAAGAVVTVSTEPYTIVAGVPARVIGRRSATAGDGSSGVAGNSHASHRVARE